MKEKIELLLLKLSGFIEGQIDFCVSQGKGTKQDTENVMSFVSDTYKQIAQIRLREETFEDYLESEFLSNHSNGVTKDKAGDAFEAWLEKLDGNEYIEYAQKWGDKITA